MRCKICPSKGRNELVLNWRILQLKYRNKRARKWLDSAIFSDFSICTNSPIKWHSRGQRFDPAYLHQTKPVNRAQKACWPVFVFNVSAKGSHGQFESAGASCFFHKPVCSSVNEGRLSLDDPDSGREASTALSIRRNSSMALRKLAF